MRITLSVAVALTTFTLLVAVGLDLTAGDFTRLQRQRALILTGLFAPLALLPLLASWLIQLFDVDVAMASALLVLAACPIGGISNTYSYLARASTALSVTLTGLSCLASSITIPLAGRAIEWMTGRPLELRAPVALLLVQFVLLLGLPVALGMIIRRRSPAGAAAFAPMAQRLAFIGIAAIVVLVVASDPRAFGAGLRAGVPVVTAFVIASFGIGWAVAMPFTREPADRFTLAAEFGTRNLAIATAVAVTILGRVDFARSTTIYGVIEIPLMLGAASVFRAFRRRA